MTVLETKIVEYCACHRRLGSYADIILDEVQAEFNFTLSTAKDWGEVSGIPEMVMDVCIRSSGIDWIASRGPRIQSGVDSSLTFGKLVTEAYDAAQRYSTADYPDRFALRTHLQGIYLTLGDLVAREWNARKGY